MDVALNPPSAVVAVIVAVPAFRAVTKPLLFTLATVVLLELQVTVLLLALVGLTVLARITSYNVCYTKLLRGELEYENFNAAGAKITVCGRSVHPGYAKGKMLNSLLVAHELMALFPSDETPTHTDRLDGFFHLLSFHGDVEKSELEYIIRDFDRDKFESRKALLAQLVNTINQKYGANTVVLELKDQYFNMREKIEPVMQIIDLAKQAMEQVGVKPIIKPIRGGTDGARLSFMGLPCPNIFAGGHNFHGRYEFVPLQIQRRCWNNRIVCAFVYEQFPYLFHYHCSRDHD